MEIVRETIGQAHDEVVRSILEDGPGVSIEVQPGKFMTTWEYPEPVLIIVRKPSKPPQVSAASHFQQGFIDQYKKDLLTIKRDRERGKDFEYTYADRFFDYPLLVGDNSPQSYHYAGNGTGDGCNQIATIIDKLCKSPSNRRCVAITWVPLLDQDSVEPPCLQFVDFLLRPGIPAFEENPKLQYLSLTAPFRSHDMLSGYGPNALALNGLQEYVASKLSHRMGQPILVGSLRTLSVSCHIYAEAQADDLKAFKKVLKIS